LRFAFSDGGYKLKWDDLDAEMSMERELEIISQGRKPFVGGNWKSNGDSMFVDLFTNSVLNKISFKHSKMEVMIAPSMIHIPIFNEYSTSAIQTGAQNVSKYDSGAFTSQVTGAMLKDMDCSWCIVGHSERRHIMKETDQEIGQKTKKALDEGVNVILCIGETMIENDTKQTKKVNAK
jgi:triosephosphate isomerase